MKYPSHAAFELLEIDVVSVEHDGRQSPPVPIKTVNVKLDFTAEDQLGKMLLGSVAEGLPELWGVNRRQAYLDLLVVVDQNSYGVAVVTTCTTPTNYCILAKELWRQPTICYLCASSVAGRKLCPLIKISICCPTKSRTSLEST
jgi:hypothetical protein